MNKMTMRGVNLSWYQVKEHEWACTCCCLLACSLWPLMSYFDFCRFFSLLLLLHSWLPSKSCRIMTLKQSSILLKFKLVTSFQVLLSSFYTWLHVLLCKKWSLAYPLDNNFNHRPNEFRLKFFRTTSNSRLDLFQIGIYEDLSYFRSFLSGN